MNLHENKEDFTEAVQAVSRGLNISPALVEKDYYVTLVLGFAYVVFPLRKNTSEPYGFRKRKNLN